MPGAFAAAPKVIAKKLRVAISTIEASALSDSQIKAILVDVAEGIHGMPSVRENARCIA